MNVCPAGLATGIGSLPFTKPEPALEMILRHMPYLPHWPQLPLRGKEEGLIAQFLSPLLKTGVLTIEGEHIFFDTAHPDWVAKLTKFYEFYLHAREGDEEALKEFAFPPEVAVGFYAFQERVKEKGIGKALYFKGQLAGPLSTGFALKDEQGRPAYYDEQLRDLIRKTLALHARWQSIELSKLGRPAVVFLDDPGVSIYGQFSYITVKKDMIATDLEEIIQALHETGALAGLHSCSAIDWSILLGSRLDIISLDAYNFGETLFPYTLEIKKFLGRGGMLAWGIVPTSKKVGEEDEKSLVEKLHSLWRGLAERGLPEELLKRQFLITPACGTGLLSIDLARSVYRLTERISAIIRDEVNY